MGKFKKRIFPRDITINIGKGVPIPEHPYPGQKWKEVCYVLGATNMSTSPHKFTPLSVTPPSVD